MKELKINLIQHNCFTDGASEVHPGKKTTYSSWTGCSVDKPKLESRSLPSLSLPHSTISSKSFIWTIFHLGFCFFILYGVHAKEVYACMHTRSFQSCSTLWNSVACSLPDSPIHGVLQARILKWVAMPSSRESALPRDQIWISCSSCIAGGFFTAEPPEKPKRTI